MRPSIRYDCEGGVGIGGPAGISAVDGPGVGCDGGEPVEGIRVSGKVEGIP